MSSERDGNKDVVVVSPAREGWNTFFTFKGDDLTDPLIPGRGMGDEFCLHFEQDEVGTKSVDVVFAEPVEVHDGEVFWELPNNAFSFEDHFGFSVGIPATPTAANTESQGNAMGVPFYNFGDVLLPAPNNGPLDVDLAQAVPVPAGVDENGQKNGYWDVDPDTGTVTPSLTPGKADWNLLDFAVGVNLIRNVNLGSPHGAFQVDVYKTEYFHPKWVLTFSATRNAANRPAGTIGGWIMLFRKVTT